MGNSLALSIALRYTNLSQAKQLTGFISKLSILGLVLGVATLIAVMSVMNGFEQEIRTRILGLVPHLSLYKPGGVDNVEKTLKTLKQHSKISLIYPFSKRKSLLVVGRNAEPAVILGLPSDTPALMGLHHYLEAGDLSEGLIIGRNLADKLEISVGQFVNVLLPKPEGVPVMGRFKVGAIINTGTEIDRSLLMMSLPELQTLSRSEGLVDGMHIQITDPLSIAETGRELMQRVPYGFYANDWRGSHGNLYHAVQMSKSLVGLLVFLIVAIAVFNVVASLMMVVNDKRADIAILSTLGASRRLILKVFLYQGALIGGLGTVLGVVLGIALALLLPSAAGFFASSLGINFLQADVYPISYLPSSLQFWDVVMVAAIALFMSLLATLYPAWRASQAQPADALRYE